MKRQSKFFMKYIALVSIILILVGGFFAVSALRSSSKPSAVALEQDNPYYTIRKNATAYQKDRYKQLSLALAETPVDQEKLSGLLVQNFVADFYTWTNKIRFNDVGGLQYLHQDIQGWVNAQALETVYGDMAYYLANGGLENSLEISDVSVDVEKTEFILEPERVEYDAEGEPTFFPASEPVLSYQVRATWTYKESTRLDASEYQNEAIFTLIEDQEGLLKIVEVLDGEAA